MAAAMGWHKPDNVAGSTAPAVLVGLFVATGGLLFGYDTGSINGILAMESFVHQFATHDSNGVPTLLPKQVAIIVAIMSAGTFTGALLAAFVADWCGRRLSIIGSIGIFSFGVVLQMCAEDITMLLFGRYFAGVGVGCISVIIPLYQSEMAPRWIRGTLVCAYQISITVGLLAASIINLLTEKMDTSAAYRIPMGLQLIWACVLAGGLTILPETPRFLIKRGDRQGAGLALSRLRRLDITHPALVEELAEIEANHEYELTLGRDTWREILWGSPHLGRRTLTGCGLQMLQQLTGINFIMYYSTTFFHGAGVQSPFLISLVMNIINVFSTFPGVLVVESWGRRRLLLAGAMGMAVFQLTIAVYSTVATQGSELASKILIVFVSFFVFSYASTWGPVCWVVTSEIYPLKVRAKSISVSTASNWLLNFGIAYGTPYMVEEGVGYADLGAKVFYVWGAFCILACLFVYCMIYETSKISLEQIDEMYERVPFAWKSPDFVPSWSFQQIRDDANTVAELQLQQGLGGGNANVNQSNGQGGGQHGLQPAQTGASIDGSTSDSVQTVQTTNSDAGATADTDNRSEEEKIMHQMGISNVDFSY